MNLLLGVTKTLSYAHLRLGDQSNGVTTDRVEWRQCFADFLKMSGTGSFCLSMNMDRECSRVTVKWDHAHVVHDLTKAFNKVNHHALYIKLMKRNIPVQGSFQVTGNGTIA